MRLEYWILFSVIHLNESRNTASIKWFDQIVDKFAYEFEKYQITILTNMMVNEGTSCGHLILKQTVNRFPSVIIDVAELKASGDNRSIINMPFLNNPRSTTLCIIIQTWNEFYLQEIKGALQFFAKTSTVQMRPKCLVILSGNSHSSPLHLNELLLSAWSLKFLEFTISNVNSTSDVIILDYNPFTNVYSQSDVSAKKELFLDKLQNMNG